MIKKFVICSLAVSLATLGYASEAETAHYGNENDVNDLLGNDNIDSFNFEDGEEFESDNRGPVNPEDHFKYAEITSDAGLSREQKIKRMTTCFPLVRKNLNKHKEDIKKLYSNGMADMTEEIESKILDFYAMQSIASCYDQIDVTNVPTEEAEIEKLLAPHSGHVFRFSEEQSNLLNELSTAARDSFAEAKNAEEEQQKQFASLNTFGQSWPKFVQCFWMISILSVIAGAFLFALKKLNELTRPKGRSNDKKEKKNSKKEKKEKKQQ